MILVTGHRDLLRGKSQLKIALGALCSMRNATINLLAKDAEDFWCHCHARAEERRVLFGRCAGGRTERDNTTTNSSKTVNNNTLSNTQSGQKDGQQGLSAVLPSAHIDTKNIRQNTRGGMDEMEQDINQLVRNTHHTQQYMHSSREGGKERRYEMLGRPSTIRRRMRMRKTPRNTLSLFP